MTYLGYGASEGAIYVAQDTLVSGTGNRPLCCYRKAVYNERLNCVVASTGDFILNLNATHFLTLARDLPSLVSLIYRELEEVRNQSLGYGNKVGESKIFVFYFEDEQPKAILFHFLEGQAAAEIIDRSPYLREGALSSLPGYDETDEISDEVIRSHPNTAAHWISAWETPGIKNAFSASALKAHLYQCSAKENGADIGGELYLTAFSTQGLLVDEKVLNFPENGLHSVNPELWDRQRIIDTYFA